MGLMDKRATKEEFDNFSKEVLTTINSLKKSIESKVSDSEENIKQIEKNIITVDENIKDKESIIEENLSKIQEYKDSSEGILLKLNNTTSELEVKIKATEEYQNAVLATKDEINKSSQEVSNHMQIINKALETAKELPTNIENIEKLIKLSNDIHKEIESLKAHSIGKKSDIDQLYNDIYGQDVQGNLGVEHTDGIKDKLEATYNILNNEIENLNNTLSDKIEGSQNSFENLLNNSKTKFNEVSNKLESLLPGAMAAGLSSAYEDKAQSEKNYGTKLNKNFIWSIVGLIVIALIPVGINVFRLITTEATLLEIIKDTPNLLVAILPIYFPILWFAYSSNKKLNLSKRLVEEYTHKAVLGKTFEGLSTQIDSLSEGDNIRGELRTKLLFNLLQVSAENPGKLITDYQTADHPLMDALENSTRLSNSIDRLNKIPGFSVLAKKLSIKKEKFDKKTTQEIEKGMDVQNDLG